MTLTYGVEPKSFMETQQFPCLRFYKSTLLLTKVLGNELIELHLQMPTTEHMIRELAEYVSKAMNTRFCVDMAGPWHQTWICYQCDEEKSHQFVSSAVHAPMPVCHGSLHNTWFLREKIVTLPRKQMPWESLRCLLESPIASASSRTSTCICRTVMMRDTHLKCHHSRYCLSISSPL